MLVFALAVVCSLVFSFLCSLSEAVLLSLRHSHIQSMGKSRAAEILRQFKREIDVPIAAVLVLNTAAMAMGASIASTAYVDAFGESTVLFFSAAFTFAILLFSEIVPKMLGVTFAEVFAVPVAYGVKVLIFLFWPIIMVTGAFARMMRPERGVPTTSLDEIRLLTSLGKTEGALGARVANMIEGAATLRELKARDVMVPRSGVVYLSAQDPLEKTLKLIRLSGHSRFPFSYTGDLDEIDGVVVVKDLMFHLREFSRPSSMPPGRMSSSQRSSSAPPSPRRAPTSETPTAEMPQWENLLGKTLMVPGSTPLERLLHMFQHERRHMAIVLDEYGGTQGIVTLEDVLEEIVGEIEDESDRVSRFVIKRADGSLVCRGWAEARKVFEALGLDPDTESVSIGGFVAELVGRVPRVGDVARFEDFDFKVLQASSRRAERIQIRRREPELESTRN